MRKKLTKNFTILDNRVMKNKKISLQAKGIYALMVGLPEDWKYSIAGLMLLSVNQKTATTNAIQELEKEGLLKRIKYQDKLGHWQIEYVIYDYDTKDENPTTENPTVENPTVENRTEENRTEENRQTYKELNNKEFNNKELNNNTSKQVGEDFEKSFNEFWNEYPQRRVDKEKCKQKFKKLDLELQKRLIQDVKNRKLNDDK